MRRLEAAEAARSCCRPWPGGARWSWRATRSATCRGFAFVPDPLAEGEEKKLRVAGTRRALREEMRAASRSAGGASGRGARADPRTSVVLGTAFRSARAPSRQDGAPAASTGSRQRISATRPQRERLRSRLQAVRRGAGAGRRSRPLLAAEAGAQRSAGLRGPCSGWSISGLFRARRRCSPELREEMKALIGVRAGRYALFMPALLKQRGSRDARTALVASGRGCRFPNRSRRLRVPGPPPGWPPGVRRSDGLDHQAGPVLLRIDVAERISAELRLGRPVEVRWRCRPIWRHASR